MWRVSGLQNYLDDLYICGKVSSRTRGGQSIAVSGERWKAEMNDFGSFYICVIQKIHKLIMSNRREKHDS